MGPRSLLLQEQASANLCLAEEVDYAKAYAFFYLAHVRHAALDAPKKVSASRVDMCTKEIWEVRPRRESIHDVLLAIMYFIPCLPVCL